MFNENNVFHDRGYSHRITTLIREVYNMYPYTFTGNVKTLYKNVLVYETTLTPNPILGDWGLNKTILLCITISRGKCLNFQKYIITNIRKR